MDGWKVVWSSWNTQDIYMARNYLEANGVECLLRDELTTQTSYCANAIGGAKLLVRDEAAEEALRLLEEGGYVDAEEGAEEDEVVEVPLGAGTERGRCPFCGSERVGRGRWPDAAMEVLATLLQWAVPALRRPCRCLDCGRMWKYVRAGR